MEQQQTTALALKEQQQLAQATKKLDVALKSVSERNYQVATFEQTYESHSPSLASIVRLKDRETALLHVSAELTRYLEFTNVRDQPTGDQLDMLVSFIVDDHSALTIDDIRLFFRKCCKGEYGSNYNRIDGPTILQWLAKFEKELDGYLDYRRSIEDERIKNESGTEVLEAIARDCPEDVQRHLNKLIHKISCTDAELEEKLKEKALVKKIHEDVTRQYSSMYDTHSIAEVDAMIDAEIKNQLIQNNLFEYA